MQAYERGRSTQACRPDLGKDRALQTPTQSYSRAAAGFDGAQANPGKKSVFIRERRTPILSSILRRSRTIACGPEM